MSYSPKLKKPALMTFPEAVREMLNYHAVARVEWPDGEHVRIRDGWMMIYTNGDWHTWIIHSTDARASDWIVIDAELV